ncbi:acetyl-CoA carboxylase carboxyltransferase subunit alpha [Pasteurella multocida subsp. multocida str. Anand1_buffalo]|nr:acetyl-CoA carboxylase carboxyltransferase subunit alpha [Pasteurella multocida subsp. multocida str. Anand1_buffalo]
MAQEYLDFELPIAELEAKIESLRSVASQDDEINLDDEIARLQKKSAELTKKPLPI